MTTQYTTFFSNDNKWTVTPDWSVLIHIPTDDWYDISHWMYDDIVDFMSDEHHRESHAEMLDRIWTGNR